MDKPKSIMLIGRRWFRRGPGNTYCTCQIVVDGKTVHKTGETYGYGSYYEQAGWEWLDKSGLIEPRFQHDNGSSEPPWQYCQRHGIAYETTAIDVPREKDL